MKVLKIKRLQFCAFRSSIAWGCLVQDLYAAKKYLSLADHESIYDIAFTDSNFANLTPSTRFDHSSFPSPLAMFALVHSYDQIVETILYQYVDCEAAVPWKLSLRNQQSYHETTASLPIHTQPKS